MKITMLKASVMGGAHYHENETYEVNDKLAQQAIAAGEAFDTANPPPPVEDEAPKAASTKITKSTSKKE